jgi:hypothetical protein
MKRTVLLILAFVVLFSCKPSATEPSKQQDETFPQHQGYRVYVVDQTGWNAINMYVYGAVNDLGGNWPGIKKGGDVTVKGQKYAYFPVDSKSAYGLKENLIFNNGSGTQLKEVSISFGDNADYFFTVTASGATPLSINTGYKVEADTSPREASASKIGEIKPSGATYYNIYQVNPKLYGNSGAFNAIKGRLDDIEALGMDVLYLMPVYKQGREKAIGSPYCIADYTAVNTSYGSLDDLKALVDAAHGKGMKVMFDWVANHTAWDCAWIKDHPDWYKKDGSGNITYPTADGTWTDVAQLDFSNTSLHAAMTDAMKYWVTELDIDGYRCDYAHGPDGRRTGDFDTFWTSAISELRALKPGFLMLAESDYDKMFTDGFDMNYSRATRNKLIEVYGSGTVASFISTFTSEAGKAPEGCSRLVFATNHDEAASSSVTTDFRTAEGALGAYLILRSLPASNLFYGSQEIAFASTINFFNTLTIDWSVKPDYFKAMKEAIAKVDTIKGNITAWGAGPVLILSFENGALLVNTSATTVNVTVPDGVSAKLPSSLTVEPYGYAVY